MKEIKLTKGKVALVDDEDFEWLNKFKWCVTVRKTVCYAIRRKGSKPGVIISMHREILGLTNPKILCDHKDQNGLNNQRDNLRIANKSQNGANKYSRENTSSNYLGVTFFKRDKKWIAQIQKNSVHKYIGIFESEEEAALAYNNAAVALHGEFANLNKITA